MSDDVSVEFPSLREVVAADVSSVALDDTDLAILKELTTDARLSQRQIAANLGISAPTVGERMARLERTGVIVRYSAEIDWRVFGQQQSVYVAMDIPDRTQVPGVMSRLWEIPEVERISIIMGEWDLLVQLRVRDYAHTREILMDHVWEVETPGSSIRMITMMSIAEMPARAFATGIIDKLIADRKRGV